MDLGLWLMDILYDDINRFSFVYMFKSVLAFNNRFFDYLSRALFALKGLKEEIPPNRYSVLKFVDALSEFLSLRFSLMFLVMVTHSIETLERMIRIMCFLTNRFSKYR
ncbi:hypothetical protein HF1_04600 [Mycoplasma haemofelis str. Langford 1]|uniref:Uncharacterized protein n=2 Tax=Mycoplasma haemofelis TaxID=29501 RepID=F6FHN5_MYCHI|nr:hypothetical protein MHF_0502 [Mycoplasma haemofelis Ohio2]CBY92468.1 hypothetical protein HF1_04600 [Mycoplasma haemofelis str. Langford 1]